MYNLANASNAWDWSPWVPLGVGIGVVGFVLAVILVIAVIILKGYALWNAAKRDEKWWFIILLVVNTLGILELIYLAFVVKKWKKPQVTN